MTGTVADYVRRKADILLYGGRPVVGRDTETPPALASGAQLTTGLEKAVQWFVGRLLTPAGTVMHRSEKGTDFVFQARSGYWRTTVDVSQDFLVAAALTLQQLADERLDTDPDDEIIASYSLDSVSVAGGTVSIRVTLTTRAGEKAAFILPVDVAVRG